jgi:putative restriction endonuclease
MSMTSSSPSEPPEEIGVAMPLFGGQEAYVDTLERVLKFVEMANPDKEKLVQWFKISFSNVSSDDSIGRRITFLTSVDFLEQEGKGFRPGPAGRRYLKTSSPDIVYNSFAKRIDYLEEILAYLTQGEVTIEALQQKLDQDYDRAKWKVNWLISMGFANPVDGETCTATDEGADACRTYSPHIIAEIASE